MAELTREQIKEALDSQIDYKELTRLIELDLNILAQELITQPEDYIEFKGFFDFGEFDTTINLQAPGEGNGFYPTPVLVSLIDGNYTTQKGPQVFSTIFTIEAFGFEKDAENLRKIFDAYSKLNQGQIKTDEFGHYKTISFTDFPVMTTPTPYKGMNRLSVFITLNLSFIYDGQLSNQVRILLDNEEIDLLSFNISRQRIGDSIQRNNKDETETIQKAQILSFSGSFIYNGSNVGKKVVRNIKNLGYGLNQGFILKVIYSDIGNLDINNNLVPDTDTYNVIISEGDITILQGGYLQLTFSMVING